MSAPATCRGRLTTVEKVNQLDHRLRIKLAPYMFLLPNLLVFGVFIIVPALSGFYYSLTEWDVISTPEFVGFENFAKILTSSRFWETTVRTFIYVFSVVPLTVVASLTVAMLLNREIKAKGTLRALFYLPTMLSFIVIGVSWRWILGNNFGILNYILDTVGLQPINWLTQTFSATVMVILASIWARTGYFMVIFLAGLQGIPEMYYEAAVIDGASRGQKFRFITLPLLTPTTLVVVVLDTIQAFKMFGLIKVMTEGGPGRDTTYLVQAIYEEAFQRSRMGSAAAMSVVLFFIMAILTLVQFRASRKGQSAYE